MDHALTPLFPELARFPSTRALLRSELWERARPEVERVLGSVVVESFAAARPEAPGGPVRAVAWNVERGARLEGVLAALAGHPRLAGSDLLLLTELDDGMARSGNRAVAREIARALGLDYAFAPCYLSLAKGAGLESRVEGENERGIHGNALFSRWPLKDAHSVPLPNGKDKMRGQEKRLGCQRAVVATVEHPAGPFRAVSVHLDAHSSQEHRRRQMRVVLDHLDRLRPALPALVGGDWNTCTYNSSRALWSILGFWLRVLIGPRRVVRDHYPHPERFFERRLFRDLDRRGWRWRDLNALGAPTFHYDVRCAALRANLEEWVPQWCFPFIHWSLQGVGGRCSLKLDWFAGSGLEPVPGSAAVLPDAAPAGGARVSDHEPIVLAFRLAGA